MNLYFVFLRRAGSSDPRNDPFWEFGSFGCTGCHSRNLLHPRRTRLVDGDRLAFLQGGEREIRIVGVTPPISVEGSNARVEIKWNAKYRPIPYARAPLLIDNSGKTAFSRIRPIVNSTNRSTFCSAAASRFRSRTSPIEKGLASQILKYFAADDLPRTRLYSEAVAPEASSWFQSASRQGWAAKETRRKVYQDLYQAAFGRSASKTCTTGRLSDRSGSE